MPNKIEKQEKKVKTLQFLTLKGLVTALNLGESQSPNPALLESAKTKVAGPRSEVGSLCAKMEMEVAQIEDPTERAEFLKNARRWSQMPPAERQAWRDLVANVPEWPPMPPGFTVPPPPPPLPPGFHLMVATNSN